MPVPNKIRRQCQVAGCGMACGRRRIIGAGGAVASLHEKDSSAVAAARILSSVVNLRMASGERRKSACCCVPTVVDWDDEPSLAVKLAARGGLGLPACCNANCRKALESWTEPSGVGLQLFGELASHARVQSEGSVIARDAGREPQGCVCMPGSRDPIAKGWRRPQQ